MAYQPKSYRKFVATAATATLVATAFAPFASAHEFKDVETKYNDAVDFLVSKGVTGYTDGTFKTQNNIKRIEAAEILAKALGLNEVKDAPASGFTDVPARAVTLINAFKAAGITTGKTETTFGSNDLITRGELAIWIQKAYELKAKEDASNEFTDVADRYKAAVQALVDAEITQGTTETTFGTTANAKRGDFALFVKRAHDVANAPKAEVVVEAVEVKDATTVVLTLKNAVTKAAFEGANIQGEGTREIGEITVSEDGKTVTLSKVAPAFEDGKEYVVNIGDKTLDHSGFKYEATVTEAKVESVSAITSTSVVVNFPALTEDVEGVTVDVKDPNGKVVAVEAQDLSAGEKTVEFAFVTAVKAADLTGVWTVDGVEFNLGLVNLLADFEATTSQLELFDILAELGITDVKAENAAAYVAKKADFLDELAADDKELTVEAVQAFIKKVNASTLTTADKTAAAQAVVKALGNNVALKAALQNAAFTKVNVAWIENITSPSAVNGYATELAAAVTAGTFTATTVTAANVQAIIDDVNEDVIAANVTALSPSISVDKTKLATLKAAIENYAPVNEDGTYVNTANKTAVDNIVVQSAVADVLAATTASKFKSTVTTLAGLVNTKSTTVIDLTKYADANGKSYIDKIKAVNATGSTVTVSGVTGTVNLAAEINSVITAVNTEVKQAAAVELFTKLETATNNLIAVQNSTTKSKFADALTAAGVEEVSSNTANVDAYYSVIAAIKTAVQTVTTPATPGNGTSALAAIQALVDAKNIAVVDAADKDGILAALAVIGTKNVVAANAEVYVTAVEGLTTEADIQTAIDNANTTAAVTASVKAINDATTAAEVKSALDTLADNAAISGYTDVTSADRIFIAENVLKTRNALKAYADDSSRDAAAVAKKYFAATEVATAVTSATTARTTAINGVNTLTSSATLSAVATALNAVGHDSLSGLATPTAADTLLAEKFIAAIEFKEDGTIKTKFNSISSIRTVIGGLK